ncbi:MAG: hypothetical protein ACQUYJ_05810 [Ferruginibacter sp.]
MVKYTLYKKPIIFIIGFLYFIPFCKAQDLNKVQQLFKQKELARAKESVDSFVLLNSSNAQGWLLKATVYNAITKDADAKYLVADGRMDAFQALQKAMQLNSNYTNDQLKQDNYSVPFDLYYGYTNEGINYFNAGAERNDKGSYSEAFNKFKKAGQLSQYIYTNGWGLSATDTNNLYYCAKAAINAAKEEEAFLYAKKIADAGITQSQSNKGFESIYQWLVFYYKQQKDGDNLVKYAQLGMQRFTLAVYFNLILIDWQRQQKDYVNLFNSYTMLIKKQPGNAKYHLAYYNDLFNYLYESSSTLSDRALQENKLEKGLLQFIKTNATAADARLLLAKVYINQANDVVKQMQLRSTTDTKVLNIYTTAHKNLLLKSNMHLKEIVNKLPQNNSAVYSEAKELLALNNMLLKAGKK